MRQACPVQSCAGAPQSLQTAGWQHAAMTSLILSSRSGIGQLRLGADLRLKRCKSTSSGVASAKNLAMSQALRQLKRVLLSCMTCTGNIAQSLHSFRHLYPHAMQSQTSGTAALSL